MRKIENVSLKKLLIMGFLTLLIMLYIAYTLFKQLVFQFLLYTSGNSLWHPLPWNDSNMLSVNQYVARYTFKNRTL
jgi:hypothetical protein